MSSMTAEPMSRTSIEGRITRAGSRFIQENALRDQERDLRGIGLRDRIRSMVANLWPTDAEQSPAAHELLRRIHQICRTDNFDAVSRYLDVAELLQQYPLDHQLPNTKPFMPAAE